MMGLRSIPQLAVRYGQLTFAVRLGALLDKMYRVLGELNVEDKNGAEGNRVRSQGRGGRASRFCRDMNVPSAGGRLSTH